MQTSGERDGGDPAAFEALAVPLLSSLFNFARWLTKDENDAEDLVQETFARALRGFPTFEEGTNFKAWIFRILKNVFLSSRSGAAHRLARATVRLETEDDGESANGKLGATLAAAATSQTPESILIAASDRRLVHDAIAALPEATREVVLLRDVEELSYREIAVVLSIPIGTVMSRVSRGRDAIRSSIRGRG